MGDYTKNIDAQIEGVLRYVAPGFVAVIFIMLGFPELRDQPDDFLRAHPGYLIFGAIILGVILNSIHKAFLEDVLVLWLYCRSEQKESPQKRSFKEQISRGLEKFSNVETARRLRRISRIPEVRELQLDQDSLGATLTFLYCSSYPCILIFIYQCFSSYSIDLRILLAGVLFFVFGYACNIRYARADKLLLDIFPFDAVCEDARSSLTRENQTAMSSDIISANAAFTLVPVQIDITKTPKSE